MKSVDVNTYTIPATARSKNYGLAIKNASSGSAQQVRPAASIGGTADVAKVAQNLSQDSSDWDCIIRKDKDDYTEHLVTFKKGIDIRDVNLDKLIISTSADEADDNSAYTSLASKNNFVSKKNDDTIEGKIVFKKAINVSGVIIASGGIDATTIKTSGKATLDNAEIKNTAQFDGAAQTDNYASRTTGWGITHAGAADFRNIYADELTVQAFTADIAQALAGSDFLTKSVSKLSYNFTVRKFPIYELSTFYIDDIEGFPATWAFEDGDYIRFRAIVRNAGLTVTDIWGTVTRNTDIGLKNGVQPYIFSAITSISKDYVIYKGAEVLDYGKAGDGFIARTTLDKAGSPYSQVVVCGGTPNDSTQYAVKARLGNLAGIANCSGYGLYSENAFLTKSILVGDLTKANNYLSYNPTDGLVVRGDIQLSSGENVSDAINGISVGGRNLYAQSNLKRGYWSTKDDKLDVFVENNSSDYTTYDYIEIADTVKEITISLYDTITEESMGYGYMIAFNSDKIKIGDVMHEQWKTPTTNTYTLPTGTKYLIIDLEYGNKYRYKVETGNKATDWTPAPEDTVSKDNIISSINLTKESITIDASKINLDGYLTISSYNSDVIGGRNLIFDSNFKGNPITSSEYGFGARTAYIESGKKYILSVCGYIDAQALADGKELRVFIYTDDWASVIACVSISSTEKTVGSVILESTYTGTVHIQSFLYPDEGSRTGTATSVWYLLEEGTKATNWIPSPEDVALCLGYADYTTMMSQARKGNTIIDGGYINTALIQAESILATQIKTSEITSLGAVTAGSFNLGSGKFVVDANGNLTATNANISGSITATEGKIGGFNIINNGLTNRNIDGTFTEDAYIIFRQDSKGIFGGIGTDVFSSVYGDTRCVARFENEGTNSWGYNQNVACYVSAKGATTQGANVALMIGHGCIGGLSIRTKEVSANYEMDCFDGFISCYNTREITVKLPSLPEQGRMTYIMQVNSSNVIVNGNGKTIMDAQNRSGVENINIGHGGEIDYFVYDGQFWCHGWTAR